MARIHIPGYRVTYEQRKLFGAKWTQHSRSTNQDGSKPMDQKNAENLRDYLTVMNKDESSLYCGRIRNIEITRN